MVLKKTEYAVNLQIKLCYFLSNKQKKHEESLEIARKAVNNIHSNILELVKVAYSVSTDDESHKKDVTLFSDQKTDKFIIEANNERKNEITKQIISTLENITDNFVEKKDLNRSRTSWDANSSTNSSKL